MTTLERDGEMFLLVRQEGLGATTLSLTRNEMLAIYEAGRVLLFPPPVPAGGPDEPEAA